MADGTDDELALARAEARVLTDQLRQARADLHRLGIADQNRALLHAAVSRSSSPTTVSGGRARWRSTTRPVGLGANLATTGALSLTLAAAFWPKRRAA